MDKALADYNITEAKDRSLHVRRIMEETALEDEGWSRPCIALTMEIPGFTLTHPPPCHAACFPLSESGVEFDEFLKYCEAKERVLRRVFDTIDHDNDGNLNRGELRVALDRLGISATDEEVRAAIEETPPAPLCHLLTLCPLFFSLPCCDTPIDQSHAAKGQRPAQGGRGMARVAGTHDACADEPRR